MAWGILILFGGGLALAKGLEEAGLIQLLGNVLAQIAPDNLFLLDTFNYNTLCFYK